MRLIELSLHNVRGVENRTVPFATDTTELTGVVIVEGPNEAGKTTLRDAFVALLTYKASSKHSDVKLLQTSGRDEPPGVSATFKLGERTFTYRKQFTKRPTTELIVTGTDPIQLSGDEAHDYVVKALDEKLDRGLWQALWLTQRELATQPAIDDARGLTRVLDAGTKTAAVGMIEHAVVDAARRHYASFFTEKTGKLRTELKQLDEAYDTALNELEQLNQELAAVQNDSDERDRLERELPRLDQAVTKAEHDAAKARDAVLRVTTWRNDLRIVGAELEAATAKRDTLVARNEQQQRLTFEQSQRAERIDVLAEEHAAYDTALTALAVELANAEQARLNAQHERDEARRARQHADKQRQLRQAVDEREIITKRRDRLIQLEHERAQTTHALNENPFTQEVLEHLERLQHAVDVARIQQQQTAPDVTVNALMAFHLSVDGIVHELAAGDNWQATLTTNTGLAIGDVAKLAITLPKADTHNAWANATRALDDALRQHDVATIEEARAKRDQRLALSQQLAHQSIEYDTMLGDDTREAIEQAYALLDHSTDTTGLGDTATLDAQLHAAREREQLAEHAYDTADTTERELRVLYDAKSAQVTTTRITLANEQAEQERIERELHAHETSNDNNDLMATLNTANDTVTALQQQQDVLNRQLAEAGADDIDALNDNAQAVLRDLKTARETTQRRREQLDTTIRVRGGDGLFERREEHATRCTRLQEQRDAQQHRAAVAKRLYDTLETHRGLAHSRYIAPLYDEILRFGRLLYGATFDIELNDSLAIARRHVDGVWLDLEQLSAGAQEQLALISRLACARLLGDEGGVVFFDDALGHTDQQRLERLGAVLRLAGQHTQLVVLTCDGERFRHVGGATRIVL
ncbi:MAG: AAA family ATPase [Nitriliruptoraceae bacterium]